MLVFPVSTQCMDLIPYCVDLVLQKDVGEAKYNGLLEKKWTAVIRLQRKVRTHPEAKCVRACVSMF